VVALLDGGVEGVEVDVQDEAGHVRPRLHPPPETPIRVLVAEDEVLLRSALPDLLHAVAPGAIEVVAQCGTREEAIRHTRSLQPDVVLLDLRMPDREGGPCTLGGAETVAGGTCKTPHRSGFLLNSAGNNRAAALAGVKIWFADQTNRAGQ
jgi:hypothetical protein